MYNETAQAELRRLARTDPLTGALNRLALDEEGQRLFDQGDALAAVMLDADHFKTINDRFGHAVGDRVLAALARGIAGLLRPGDVLGRAGGEEFLLLLPRSDLAGAVALAEALRVHVAGMALELDGQAQPISVSIGVAVRTAGDRDVACLVKRADRALYEAKRAGRNRVVAAGA
jgi:diguanylate cyclase (GGDEF)-like protein